MFEGIKAFMFGSCAVVFGAMILGLLIAAALEGREPRN